MRMSPGKKHVILAVAILAAGALRMPFERTLTAELAREGLLPPRLEVETGERIGQTFSAVALGGLRTLVATFLNLRAFSYFTEQKWGEVAETFDMIVDLAPRTRYYWDTGSWHQAYNAASHYLYGSELPTLRRKLAWRESILIGRGFLERGIRNNPQDPVLRERLAALLSDPNKIAAFGDPEEAYLKAYGYYMDAVRTGNARDYAKRGALYSLARVPGRERDALELAREIREEQGRTTPTMLGLFYTLRFHEDPDQPVMDLVDSVFPSREVAYQVLGAQWLRTRDRFPVHGIAKALSQMERALDIPEENSVLKQELQAPMSLEDYFPDTR